MSAIESDGFRQWVRGTTGARYTIRPVTSGLTPVQMIDAHLTELTRTGQPTTPDIDDLLDARLSLALEEAIAR